MNALRTAFTFTLISAGIPSIVGLMLAALSLFAPERMPL